MTQKTVKKSKFNPTFEDQWTGVELSHMEKKKFYVMPQSAEVLPIKDNAVFALEIEATEEQVTYLRQLFDDLNREDLELFLDGHYWAIEETHNDNIQYDQALREIYKKVYEWGTPQTKQKLEEMVK